MIPDLGSEWKTSVDALVRIFRDALLALIPVVERARIPWREGESYDAWDEVVSVLYAKLVREPLAWGLNAVDDFKLPGYDLVLDSWRDTSFGVQHSRLAPEITAVFLRFGTEVQPMDTVVVSVLDDTFASNGREERLPFRDVTFVLEQQEGGRHLTITSLIVPD